MDWSRAKTILIISFLFLNLLLIYQMWATRWHSTISSREAAEIKQDALANLADKQIHIPNEIPKSAPKLRQIFVSYIDNSGNSAWVNLSQPIPYAKPASKSQFRRFLNQASLKNASDYVLDPALSNTNQYIFNQMYDHLPLFDVTLQLHVKNTEITGYKQAQVAVQSEGSAEQNKPQRVISAYTALRSISDYLPAGSVISDIQLGYHGQSFDAATHPMLPYWRIVLDEGQTYYVQAFSGAVEGN